MAGRPAQMPLARAELKEQWMALGATGAPGLLQSKLSVVCVWGGLLVNAYLLLHPFKSFLG